MIHLASEPSLKGGLMDAQTASPLQRQRDSRSNNYKANVIQSLLLAKNK